MARFPFCFNGTECPQCLSSFHPHGGKLRQRAYHAADGGLALRHRVTVGPCLGEGIAEWIEKFSLRGPICHGKDNVRKHTRKVTLKRSTEIFGGTRRIATKRATSPRITKKTELLSPTATTHGWLKASGCQSSNAPESRAGSISSGPTGNGVRGVPAGSPKSESPIFIGPEYSAGD